MKIREITKRGMTLLLAAMMMLGTPMTALAADDAATAEAAITNANNAAEEGDFTYNYNEETKEISVDPVETANETVVMGSQTGTVGAQEAVANAEAAALEAEKVVADAQVTMETLKGDAATFNGATADTQKNVDALAVEVTNNLTPDITTATATVNTKTEALKEVKDQALEILTDVVLSTDGQERIDAAAEVVELAGTAKILYNEAYQALTKVEKEYNATVYEYNLYAVLYNQPLYGTTEVTYVKTEDGSMDAEVLKEAIKGTMDLSSYTSEAAKEAAVKTALDEILAKKTAIQLKADAVHANAQVIQDSTIEQASENVKQAQIDYNLAKNVYDESKKTAEIAKEAAIKAGAAVGDFETIKEIVSNERIEGAVTKVDAAETALEAVKAEASKLDKLNTVELATLLGKIQTAEIALEAAKETLATAKTYKDTTQQYAEYANDYAGYEYENLVAQTGTAYARVEKDESGNNVYLTVNTDYDLTNSEVVSRPAKNFTNIIKLNGLEIPEAMFEEYLKAVVAYENGDSEGVNDEVYGRGISTGDTLPMLYWEIGADGNLTGTYYTSTTQLTNGRYFIGYSFKKETDIAKVGYHLDGIMFDYTAPVVPETPDTPVTPPVTPGTDDTPVIPALFTAGAGAPVVDTGVLGATRLGGEDLEAAVLGARRGTDQAVLGRRRSPSTGDTVAMSAWAMAMAVAAGAAIFAGTKLVTGKKKEEQ